MKKNQKGFTLVELISVISLLLVLSVLAVAAYGNITEAARNAAIQADANALARAMNTYESIHQGLQMSVPGHTNGAFAMVAQQGVNGALIDIDLSVVVPADRADDVADAVARHANGMWWVPGTSTTTP